MKIKLDSKELLDKYSDMIYRIAISYLRNVDDAEDIVQDVFLKYIKKMKEGFKFENDSHEKFWIIRVTINLCINKLNAYYYKNVVSFEENSLNQAYFMMEEIDLLEDINKLDEKYRIVFELFYMQDYKISDISKLLNITESNVKKRLSRARNFLREKLQIGGKLHV